MRNYVLTLFASLSLLGIWSCTENDVGPVIPGTPRYSLEIGFDGEREITAPRGAERRIGLTVKVNDENCQAEARSTPGLTNGSAEDKAIAHGRHGLISERMTVGFISGGGPVDLEISMDERGEDAGGGAWAVEVAARLWDVNRNPVPDRIPVVFTIEPELATITPGYTGNSGRLHERNIIIENNFNNGRENGAQFRNNHNRHSIIINAAVIALGESFTFQHQNDDWEPYQGP